MIKLPFTLPTTFHLIVTIQQIAQFQELNFLYIGPFLSIHLQFHDHVKNLVLDIIIIIRTSILVDLHDAQDTLNFLQNEESLDPLIIPLSEKIVLDHFLDVLPEIDSISETRNFHIDLCRNHAQELRRHLEDLLKNYYHYSLKPMIITQKNFQSRKTNLKSICIPRKWQML